MPLSRLRMHVNRKPVKIKIIYWEWLGNQARMHFRENTTKEYTYNQMTNPSITPAKPILIPAISLPPFAVPLVADGEADGLVFEAAVALDVVVGALRFKDCPIVGSATLPSTSQPFDVDEGHAGTESAVAEAE